MATAALACAEQVDRPVKSGLSGQGRPRSRTHLRVTWGMTFHPTGLVVFAAFVVVFMLAMDARHGLMATAAWGAIELVLWSGVAGLGRHTHQAR
jgi:hypothetical protein